MLSNKVIFANYLLKKLKEKCSAKSGELGFYMIGFKRKEPIVLELVEFKYIKRSSVSVISDPNFTGFIFSTLPPIYRVIGTLHRHPGNMLSLSSTDIKNFKNWQRFGEYIHVVTNEDCSSFAAYLFKEDYYVRIPVEFRQLRMNVKYITTQLPGKLRIYFMEGMKSAEVIPQLERSLIHVLRSLYIPFKLRGSLFDNFKGIMRRTRGIIYVHLDDLNYPLMMITEGSITISELKSRIKELFENDYIVLYNGMEINDNEKCRKYWSKDLYFRRV